MSTATAETSFSQQIRAATTGAHGSAQHSGFMADLFGGNVDRERYARFHAQHFFVYEALERAADTMRDDPVAGPFVRDELTRLPAFEKDLTFLLGEDWRDGLAPEPATAAYVARIEEAAAWPGGFVAHHYVRYLGDLSGGQHIAKFIARKLEFDGEGVLAFAFPGIADLDVFKDEYRQLLDDADWSADERARIVDEILVAYEHATAMLRDL